MKKNIFKIVLIGLLVFSFSPIMVAGADPYQANTTIKEDFNLTKTIDGIINWFFGIIIATSIIMIIWAGLEFVLAGGNADKVGVARKRLTWALIGFIIAFISRGLVKFIQTFIK